MAASCSQVGTPSASMQAKDVPPPPMYVGTVDMVYPDKHFALIRVISPMPDPGTTLISHAPEGFKVRAGNLVVSEERLDPLRIPADIRSGMVMVGDYVYAYRPLSEPKIEEPKAPAASGAATEGDPGAEAVPVSTPEAVPPAVRTDVPAWQSETEGGAGGSIPSDSVPAPDVIPDSEGTEMLPAVSGR